MVEAGAALLLLSALFSVTLSLSFYGDSISFMSPQKNRDGTFKVTFHHRQNGRDNCQDLSSFTCDGTVCSNFEKSSVLQTDQDDTGRGRWCQTEGSTTAVIVSNSSSFSLRDSGCCWLSNVNGKTNWTSQADLDLGTRSDSKTINTCPVTTSVSSLRVPQNCFRRIRLLTHDPDGDYVRCRFAAGAKVSSNFNLNEAECTLTSTGRVDIGVHVFEVMLEDFPREDITLTYSDGRSAFRVAADLSSPPLCKVKLQFLVEILPSIPNCEDGHVQPMFLSTTPTHGDVLYATVDQIFHLNAQAQAHHTSIHDFQVSGPQNMTKVFTDERNGKAKLTLSWTPHHRDLYRLVPVCFTAETAETQSDMRCVVVLVTQASITQGKATVDCSSNKMVVAIEKASMPDIDVNYLKLRDKSCSLTSNSTHIMGSMSFSTCGTKLEDKGDFIVFTNEINSFELPTEIIVRRKTVKINFSCQFPKTISISSYYNLHMSDYIFTETSFGSFGYSFDIYRDRDFINKVDVSAYPVEIKLLETIYLGIQAQSDLPNVKLFVESCKGTPDDNPENSLFYDLIKNGCLQDETLKVFPSNQTSFNFEFQAFKFTGNYEQVYITCSVILCDPESRFSRCAQGCLKDASRRRRRGVAMETLSHYIVQGPLKFVGQTLPIAAMEDNYISAVEQSDAPNHVSVMPPPGDSDRKSSAGGWEIQEKLTSNISAVVFGSLFLVSLVALAVVLFHFTRKREAEDHKTLVDSEWEN